MNGTPGDDEWRISLDVGADRVNDVLHSIEHAEPTDFGRGVRARYPVSHSDDRVFVYTGSEEAARTALAELDGVIAEHDLREAVTVSRWHPIEERWEDASVPLPETDVEVEREHARREELETQRSRESGISEWEVRVTLPSREAAREFERRLRDEGVPTTRAWRHVMAGASDEDDARALAQRLRDEVPEGSLLHVEPSGAEAWEITHPFPYFGGLGG